jgi:hypothetical protein
MLVMLPDVPESMTSTNLASCWTAPLSVWSSDEVYIRRSDTCWMAPCSARSSDKVATWWSDMRKTAHDADVPAVDVFGTAPWARYLVISSKTDNEGAESDSCRALSWRCVG